MHINKDAGLPRQLDSYLAGAVSITPTGDASAATRLFKTQVALTGGSRDYDVTDAGRFLINVTNPTVLNPVATPIRVHLNWTATLHKK